MLCEYLDPVALDRGPRAPGARPHETVVISAAVPQQPSKKTATLALTKIRSASARGQALIRERRPGVLRATGHICVGVID